MNNGRQQVIFVTDGIFPYSVGGMQRHSRLLIEALARTNQLDLIVVHPHQGKKIFEGFGCITELALPFKEPRGQWSYLVSHYRYSKAVYRILIQFPQAVIYSQGLAVWYNIRKVAHRMILNPHGLEPFQVLTVREKLITTLFRWVHLYLFRYPARVVSLGGRLTEILEQQAKVNRNRIVILPNAVNLPSENRPARPERNYIQFIFVGRFAFNKGIDILIKAAQQLNSEGWKEKLRFVLVGKGPLYDSFKEQVQDSNIELKGGTDDETLFRLYSESDAFVFPTLFEGMPTVALEAMSHRLPLIITDTGATLELAGDDNAIIIEKRSVDSLKNAILKFAQLDAAERLRMANASYRKVCDNFTWPVVARRHIDAFKNLPS